MMNPTMNQLLFVMLPYVALFSFFLGTIMRYRKAPFSYSSLSSQFLENNQHFWGVTALHYGIITALAGHLVGLLIPRCVLAWNSQPLRLYVLEISGLAGALFESAQGYEPRGLDHRSPASGSDRCWNLYRGVSSMGFFLVCDFGDSLPAIHFLFPTRHQLPRHDAFRRQAAHGECLAVHRVVSVHSPGARVGSAASVSVAQAATGALVRDRDTAAARTRS